MFTLLHSQVSLDKVFLLSRSSCQKKIHIWIGHIDIHIKSFAKPLSCFWGKTEPALFQILFISVIHEDCILYYSVSYLWSFLSHLYHTKPSVSQQEHCCKWYLSINPMSSMEADISMHGFRLCCSDLTTFNVSVSTFYYKLANHILLASMACKSIPFALFMFQG